MMKLAMIWNRNHNQILIKIPHNSFRPIALEKDKLFSAS